MPGEKRTTRTRGIPKVKAAAKKRFPGGKWRVKIGMKATRPDTPVAGPTPPARNEVENLRVLNAQRAAGRDPVHVRIGRSRQLSRLWVKGINKTLATERESPITVEAKNIGAGITSTFVENMEQEKNPRGSFAPISKKRQRTKQYMYRRKLPVLRFSGQLMRAFRFSVER